MIGRTLLHYQIVEKIGEGGMGTVYKALDTHLDRPVAIKVLPPDKVADPERKRRFIQEAKAASALRHPNIVVIHDIADDGGVDFIVMELVEGQPLDRLIGRHGMGLSQALGFAVQIADGLAKAHAAGIVHRDIKPTNIMVTGEGSVKILDFGLAKLVQDSPPPAGMGPTLTVERALRPATEEGSIVGTAAYMSPEQAEGLPVDARSDIFSFGLVLYEMLSGQRAFQRDSRLKTLAAVLGEDPKPLSAVAHAQVPAEVEKVVGRCLRKDTQRRWQTMSDLKVALQDLREDSESGRLAPAAGRVGSKKPRWIVPAAAAVLLLAVAAVILNPFRPKAATEPTFEISRLTDDSGVTAFPTVTPDGTMFAYQSDREDGRDLDIWIQPVGGGKPLKLTDDPADDSYPSFDPSGSKIAFRSERAGGGIYVVDALGGDARLVAEKGTLPRFSPDGSQIAYVMMPASGRGTLFKMHLVPARGGPSTPFLPEFQIGRAVQGAAPVWSPDGKKILFSGRRVDDPSSADWWIAPIDGKDPVRTRVEETVTLVGTAFPTAWVGNDIYFISGMTVGGINIFRVPFEEKTGAIRGPAVPLTAGPGMKYCGSVTRDGRVLFADLSVAMDAWFLDARTDEAVVSANPRKLTQDRLVKLTPTISRDGTTAAYVAYGSGEIGINLLDMTSDKQTVVPLQGPDIMSRNPRLSPDGSILTYRDLVDNKWQSFLLPRGAASGRKVCESCSILGLFRGAKDGLVLAQPDRLDRMDLATGERKPVFAATAGSVIDADLAPDDGAIAYLLGLPDGRVALGIARVGVPEGPAPGNLICEEDRYLSSPRWSPNGQYLYFLSERNGRCTMYAQKIDRATLKPVGQAREVYSSPGAKFNLNYPKGLATLVVAADKILFSADEMEGNIFIAKPVAR